MTEPLTVEDLLLIREGQDFEAKAAQGRTGRGEIPESAWETYSGMANTDGGVVLLGVAEHSDGTLEFVGIKDIARVRKTFWDTLNNSQKVSINLLTDRDVQEVSFKGVESPALLISVPPATRKQRPVFVGRNPFDGTFKRNYEGDYRCSKGEVERMFAERVQESRDARILPKFTLKDLNPESLAAYRQEFRTAKPTHAWNRLRDEDFLQMLGARGQNRDTGEEGLTVAGLLMFGNVGSILEVVPGYIVDYRERLSDDPQVRWTHRIHQNDGDWSGNLYDFFTRVYARLVRDLDVPFRIEGHQRIDDSRVHRALLEALVNAIIHADYDAGTSILIIKYPDRFTFANPGGLRVPLHSVYDGGVSDCRNRSLQKMFQMIGHGEQAGSGFPTIIDAWRGQHWRLPLLEEDKQNDRTTLELPLVGLLSPDAMATLDQRFGPPFRELDVPARIAVVAALHEEKVTNERLRFLGDVHAADATRLLGKLVADGFLVKNGERRNAFYTLPEVVAPSQRVTVRVPDSPPPTSMAAPPTSMAAPPTSMATPPTSSLVAFPVWKEVVRSARSSCQCFQL